jgi:hypothetical protein
MSEEATTEEGTEAPASTSLLTENAPAPAEAAPAGQEAAWLWAEDVPGSGDRPEWMLEKFSNVGEQAKAFHELEGKYRSEIGAFAGAPEVYEFNLPEGVQADLDPEDPLVASFSELCHENNVTQEFYDQVVGTFMQYAAAGNAEQRAEQLGLLGAEGPQMVQDVWAWGKANLDEDQFSALQTVCTTAEAVKLFSHLTSKYAAASNIPERAGQQGAVSPADEAALFDLLKDPRWESDPNYQQSVQSKFSTFYAGDK